MRVRREGGERETWLPVPTCDGADETTVVEIVQRETLTRMGVSVLSDFSNEAISAAASAAHTLSTPANPFLE